ncbi:MAG: universal stress protein [bacterium]|jgi:nucleotide-binding universal stress UspA family protein|nr:universal stress protein [Betaproteobacteria bacterium]
MFKRILIPIDGSKTSQQALKRGIAFAAEQGAALRLLHVHEVSVLADMYAAQTAAGLSVAPNVKALEKFEADLEKRSQSLLEQSTALAAKAGVAKVDGKMINAGMRKAAKLIVDDATKWKADLIVMGTHGRSGFDHLVFGSVAEGVMRTATVPVLLIRSPGK